MKGLFFLKDLNNFLMTTINFLKKISANQLKLAVKLSVRDLDETEKNSFVAYIDDGSESFDVQLILDTKKNIVSLTCDCKTGENCLHKIALIDFLDKQKTTKKILKKPIKKKSSENDILLEEIDFETLKNWVSNLVNSNKEIAFLFTNEFGQKKNNYDSKEISTIIKTAIQSVIGKRRTIATAEIKKIVDNLNVSLKPVIDFILSSTFVEKTHHLIETIVDELIDFESSYYISSVRITRFIENLYDLALKSLYNIKDLDVWKQNVTFYFSLVFNENSFKIYDFELVKKIYSYSEINALQQNFVLQLIEQKFKKLYQSKEYQDKNYDYPIVIDHFFLTIFIEKNLFETYYGDLKARRFENNYNILLIENLLLINQLQIAEKYCVEQINYNSNPEYDKPYVAFLNIIYDKTNNIKKKATLQAIYSTTDFTIENYSFLKENCSEADFTKYRKQVLINTNYNIQEGDLKALTFYYQILKLEDQTDQLIPLLLKSKNLHFFYKYKEIAFALNPLEFLIAASAVARYSYDDNLIEIIATYIYQEIDKEILHNFLTNNNILKTGKMHQLLRKLNSTK